MITRRWIVVGAAAVGAGAWLMACAGGRGGGERSGGEGAGVPPQVAGAGGERGRGEEEAPVQGTYTGVLHGGVMAIGGETTGWMLQGPNDGRGGGMDVDVSRVREEAQRLDGRRVVIRGRIERREYVERGEVKVLVAEEIAAAE